MNRMIGIAAALAANGTIVCFAPAQAQPAAKPVNSAASSNEPGAIQLRSMPAVLDAREKRLEWHTAAQQAADRIQDPGLKDQFNKRLTGLVPIIAKSLIARPQEDALVTVAVYRDSANAGKQAMVAVTFDGMGTDIGQTFFADVIAGLPKPPEADGIPKSLTLDTEATSYMVFFLGKNELAAGDIPHSAMGRSVVAVTTRDREHGDAVIASAQAAAARVPASTTPPSQQTDVAHPEVGDLVPNNQYAIPQGYGAVNDGYYYPSAIGVPIVILPGENPSTPDLLDRQRRRQMELEKRYQHTPNAISPTPQTETGGNRIQAVPPTADHSISGTPQSTPPAPSRQSPSANHSVTNPPDNHVSPPPAQRPTNRPAGGSGGTPPASGEKTAPPAKTPPAASPPAGSAGSPPVAGAGKK